MNNQPQKTVLIVDDDELLLDMLDEYLQQDGYTTFTAVNGADYLAILENNQIDVIVQDLLLGDDDGMELLKQVCKDHQIPVIMMSGRGEATDRILGIEAGADDYLAKPFLPKELSVRINAILRRQNAATATPAATKSSTLTFDVWTLDLNTYDVQHKNGDIAPFTTGEFMVLRKLVESPNQVFSRDQLLNIMREFDADVFERAVDIQISRIRKKLGDSASNPRYIRTIRNVGYIFIG